MAVDSTALEDVSEIFSVAAEYKQQHRREFPCEWYEWQWEGFNNHHRAVMTLAGNQTGKTLSGGYHFACDVTQSYPDKWDGFRFDHCINALAVGVDNKQLEVLQTILFGKIEGREFQGGWVHKDEIDSVQWAQSVTGIAARVVVRSKLGLNTVHLRTYSQTKTGTDTLTFAGFVVDLIWADEQPPDSLIGQFSVRLLNGNRGNGGRIRYTMTPELGKTELIQKYMDERGKNQWLIGPVSWDECDHMTPESQEAALEGIPPFEHDLRKKGVPSFGSGMVYPIAEERLRCDPFEIPEYFRCIRAIDLGIRHPQATSWLAHDTQQDIVYLVKTYAASGENAATHAVTTNSMWPNTVVSVPHDYDTLEKGAGETVSKSYKDAGLKHTTQFTNPDGSLYVEPGITEVFDRMKSGRFKVFSTCTEFWKEHRLYHRDEGKIVKKNDDVMDTVRQGVQMIGRYGRPITGIIRKPAVNSSMGRRR